MTRPSKPTSTLALLQEPRLRRLLVAQVPADLADWLDFVALGALVAFHWHLGAPALAAVTLALGLPYVVLIPFLGVIVDRADLRLVLVASNLGRAAATAAFAFAPNLATLLVLAALKSSADALFVPAKQAALPLVAPPDRLMAANGVSHAINQLSKLAGPALGGALIAVLAPQQVFLVNAGLSVIAGLLLVGLPLRGPAPRHSAGPRSMWREFREGMALFRTRPRLTLALVAMTVGFFLIFLYDGLIVLLIREIGFSQAMFGFTIAAVGAGGAAGAIALGRYGERRNPLLLMAAGSIASGLLVAATGHVGRGDLAVSAFVFVALACATGIASAAIFVPFRTIQQRETPPGMLGRVTAVSEAVTTVATVAAPPIGAVVAEMAGTPAPFLIAGYLLACFGLALTLLPRRLRDDRDG